MGIRSLVGSVGQLMCCRHVLYEDSSSGATLILNSAMFNLVEALPVMPGPFQLLHWQKMKEFKVVDEYFIYYSKEKLRRIYHNYTNH